MNTARPLTGSTTGGRWPTLTTPDYDVTPLYSWTLQPAPRRRLPVLAVVALCVLVGVMAYRVTHRTCVEWER